MGRPWSTPTGGVAFALSGTGERDRSATWSQDCSITVKAVAMVAP